MSVPFRVLAAAATPSYKALKKALRSSVRVVGLSTTIGMVTTMLLKLNTDADRPARRTLTAMAGALAQQADRVSLEDMEHFRQIFLAARSGDQAALEALEAPEAELYEAPP